MQVRRRGPLVALIVGLLALIGCTGSPAPPAAGRDPIRIGVVTICEGVFSENLDATLAGAELPFIERGAHLTGTSPKDGVTSVSVGGRQVELMYACERYGDRSTTISALSSLVERNGADIVIGPLYADDSIAVREYARAHPDITFIATGSEQSPTLRRTVPNLYRFEPDVYQWNAALGMYARRALGWDSAATFGDANAPGYQVAGFIAGFCALGGHIAMSDRLFMDESPTIDPGSLVPDIPRTVDGLFLTGTTAGGPVGGTMTMAPRWQQTHAPLARHLLVGWQLLYPPDKALRGVVGSSPDPFRMTLAWRRYTTALDLAFPGLNDTQLINQPYYDAVEPALQALERGNGDISDDERGFMDALAHLRYHAPQGLITLDRRHQAIGPVYLGRVVVKDGKASVVQIGVHEHVHQSLGGYFRPGSPAPNQTQPRCRTG